MITSPLSAAYSALAIMMVGARPVFADVDPGRATIDPERIEAMIGPRTRAILPVHLYGQPADMTAIERVAAQHNLAIVEDCCQAHLATSAGRPVGTIGAAGAFSFYPTKNLGALGDGGAVVTNDRALADRVKRLRNGGQTDRYHHQEPGINSRLDDVQAAILLARLPCLGGWTAARRHLAGAIGPPWQAPMSWCHRNSTRPRLSPLHGAQPPARRAPAALEARGIGTLVHYPTPVSRQPAFATSPARCPHANRVVPEILYRSRRR